ncbi:homoserine dehydrogenase [Paracoccaceae bacterium GXU_MW_L88]
MAKALRIGLAGLGTVGTGIVTIIQSHGEMIAARAGRPIEITAVSARSRGKDRGVDISGYGWEDSPAELAKRDDVDLLVEVMGGEDGPAKAAVEAALEAGKPVVTANKAMLALHGQALAEQAEKNDTTIRFEAAVAGGIPIIKSLTEGLAGNAITRIMGVMNGTCNYILTRMEKEGISYEDVFDDALRLGYLEADPTLDVGGIDAAHKLALLSAIGFGAQVDFDGINIEGIERVSLTDIQQAKELGYRIKLLGLARMSDGKLEQRMQPCLVPARSDFGQLDGVTNMVVVEGDSIGRVVLSGPGAGMGATASAVMGDVIDIARGLTVPVFGQPAASLKAMDRAAPNGNSAYYLRVLLEDTPGVLARVATVLGEHGISIDRLMQDAHNEDEGAQVLIITHGAPRSALDDALEAIKALPTSLADPVAIRIVQL